jgi:hypothetical protein
VPLQALSIHHEKEMGMMELSSQSLQALRQRVRPRQRRYSLAVDVEQTPYVVEDLSQSSC